ncbi:MAG TPA: carboxypeptidase-like regulatory domain-containing protein, partial [Candidatus Acidoferrales bacterium]
MPVSPKPKFVPLLVAGLVCVLAAPAGAGTPAKPAKPAKVRASLKSARPPQQRIPRRTSVATVGVQGVVRDERGIGVPEVEVKVTATTGQRRTLQAWTDGEGIFRLAEVLPGTYSIQLLKPGYETMDRSGLVVKAGEYPIWDFTLKSLTPMQSSSTACGPSAGLPTG